MVKRKKAKRTSAKKKPAEKPAKKPSAKGRGRQKASKPAKKGPAKKKVEEGKPVKKKRVKNMPVPGRLASSGAGGNRRRYPRQPAQVKVTLEATGRRGISFQATLPSADVSIGGIFLESEFFIKLGTELIVAFELPDVADPVRVQGVVVREQRRSDPRQGIRSGFAIEFTEFVDDARLALASFFLAPQISAFVQAYRETGRHNRIRGEAERMVDVIVAWEMDELERGRGRLRA